MQGVEKEGIVFELVAYVSEVFLPHALRGASPITITEFYPCALLYECAHSVLRI